MSRVATMFVFVVLAVSGTGCRVQEYVAAKDEVPLYASPALDQVIDRLPLGHHERVLDEAGDGVFKVTYNGRTGYAKKEDLKVLKYLHPDLDEGEDRDDSVGRAVREVVVGHAGTEWPGEVQEAIRAGRVVEGMTREQVELAWGWPRTIEPLANPMGAERWIYRRRGYETMDAQLGTNRKFRPMKPGARAYWGVESPSSYYRLPVVEERVVEFSERKVTRSYVRRYYDVEGGAETDDS